MRLFAAVLPPEDVTVELGAVVDGLRRLPGAGDGVRWTTRPGWHFTLAFYGEVDDGLVPELSVRLERSARRTDPFSLSLRGGGRFGGRALWAGAAGDVRTLRLLADRAVAAGRRAGVTREEHRAYRAHLTLARSNRESADFTPYVSALDGFEGRAWTVGELCLMRSRLPVSGVPGEQPRYEVLARWPLGGPPGGPRGGVG
ncbi:RNA 2',3'-cyclic phosphodiesterase [Streptomyces sp. NPDC057620]|uniref:RNA 2',3'-cyclic phosphodiesterase n=1 Tax=Streptomyces liliiviolaceus TaxID=2823109 RepID=A0A941B1T7_9ACTN|nr:RNA 2',3'-cyclic phosphodiesterase [Streptomyces liliiviolaceus]MBQ0847390.1 RNA 2',3'-cyclic phosphodiesterase [Streptomyces liliiviolaceus]